MLIFDRTNIHCSSSVIDGKTFETKIFVADYELESGDIQRREIPISGPNYSQEEIERSQEYWDRKYTFFPECFPND